ncbi:hypothetical protein [Embleya sp. NPDC020630]|uniref:hypothetical protein n=1 Tax=Embleya sp. NPDC020630 TaxID=3363979 RepID=UPI003790CB2D
MSGEMILLAAVDGLQLRWLLKPDLDMAADIETLCEVLTSALPTAHGPNGTEGRTDNPQPNESAAAGAPIPEDD